jgi:hypothetical protein
MGTAPKKGRKSGQREGVRIWRKVKEGGEGGGRGERGGRGGRRGGEGEEGNDVVHERLQPSARKDLKIQQCTHVLQIKTGETCKAWGTYP